MSIKIVLLRLHILCLIFKCMHAEKYKLLKINKDNTHPTN